MKRKILVFAMVICLLGTMNIFAEENQINIVVDGKAVASSAKIMEGELYIPLRAVAETLGFEVQWFGAKKQILLTSEGRKIIIDIQEAKVTDNGHETYMRSGSRILNGRTYLGQDFYADVLDLKVTWDKDGSKVSIENVNKNNIVINNLKECSESATLKVTVQYPELKGLESTDVENQLNSVFAKLAEAAIAEGKEAEKNIIPEQTAAGIKAEVYFTYDVKYNSNGYLSIVFQDYVYSGGAHGLTVQSSHTYDLKTGKEYAIKDLFKSGTDYVSIISAEVKKQMQEGDMSYTLTPFEAIKPDQDYYLSNKGLVVYFQQYEYYPYAMGIPEFTIDYSEFSGLLNPEIEFLK